MTVALAILTTLAAGLPVTLAIDRDARGPVLVGLSFLYGCALVYFAELALTLAGVPWTAASVTGAVLLVSSACFMARRPGRRSTTAGRIRSHWLDAITLVVIAQFTAFATLAPVWEWDFWAIWGLKARVFLGSAAIDWMFLERQANAFAHPDYPLLVPLNYAYAGLIGGGWSDRWLGLYTVAFGVALLSIVRGLSSRELPTPASAALTLALTGGALSRTIGLAEGPLIAFATASILFLRSAVGGDDRPAARHGALLLGCAALCKNEGLALLVAILVATLVTRRSLLPRLWPALAVVAPWLVVKSLHDLPGELTGGLVIAAGSRLAHPLAFLSTLLTYLPERAAWLLIALALLTAGRALRRERFVLTAVGLQLLFCVGAYLVTARDLEWHVLTSWPRVALQMMPALLFVVLAMLARAFQPGDDLVHAEARPNQ